MGRAPCCEKVGLNKGKWTEEEDQKLLSYIKANGEGSWRSLPKNAGLLRCGKSCRLRWINYLRDDLKRGNISPEEEDTIIKLQASLGNRWSLIATHLPGRTDNEIKNHWNSHLSRRIQSENPPVRKKRGRKPKSTTSKNEKPIKKRKKSTPEEDIDTNNIQPQEQQQMVQVSTTTTGASTTTCCNTPETSGETSSVEKPAGSGGSSKEEEIRIDLDVGDLEGFLLDDNLWNEASGDLWPAGINWEENDTIMDFQPNNLECNNGGCDPLEGDENLERWLQSSDFFINELFL